MAPCGCYTLCLGGAQGFPVVIRIQLAPYGSLCRLGFPMVPAINGQAIGILWVVYTAIAVKHSSPHPALIASRLGQAQGILEVFIFHIEKIPISWFPRVRLLADSLYTLPHHMAIL